MCGKQTWQIVYRLLYGDATVATGRDSACLAPVALLGDGDRRREPYD